MGQLVTGRKELRLPGYDYSQAGGYFVTLCSHNREHTFGAISSGILTPSRLGIILLTTWCCLPQWFSHVVLDCFVLMPNHFHGIVLLTAMNEREHEHENQSAGARTNSLGTVIQAFKSSVTRQTNLRQTSSAPLWQRGYYDHVIRDEQGMERIREYIERNPVEWQLDRENHVRVGLNPFYEWLEKHVGPPPNVK